MTQSRLRFGLLILITCFAGSGALRAGDGTEFADVIRESIRKEAVARETLLKFADPAIMSAFDSLQNLDEEVRALPFKADLTPYRIKYRKIEAELFKASTKENFLKGLQIEQKPEDIEAKKMSVKRVIFGLSVIESAITVRGLLGIDLDSQWENEARLPVPTAIKEILELAAADVQQDWLERQMSGMKFYADSANSQIAWVGVGPEKTRMVHFGALNHRPTKENWIELLKNLTAMHELERILDLQALLTLAGETVSGDVPDHLFKGLSMADAARDIHAYKEAEKLKLHISELVLQQFVDSWLKGVDLSVLAPIKYVLGADAVDLSHKKNREIITKLLAEGMTSPKLSLKGKKETVAGEIGEALLYGLSKWCVGLLLTAQNKMIEKNGYGAGRKDPFPGIAVFPELDKKIIAELSDLKPKMGAWLGTEREKLRARVPELTGIILPAETYGKTAFARTAISTLTTKLIEESKKLQAIEGGSLGSEDHPVRKLTLEPSILLDVFQRTIGAGGLNKKVSELFAEDYASFRDSVSLYLAEQLGDQILVNGYLVYERAEEAQKAKLAEIEKQYKDLGNSLKVKTEINVKHSTISRAAALLNLARDFGFTKIYADDAPKVGEVLKTESMVESYRDALVRKAIFEQPLLGIKFTRFIPGAKFTQPINAQHGVHSEELSLWQELADPELTQAQAEVKVREALRKSLENGRENFKRIVNLTEKDALLITQLSSAPLVRLALESRFPEYANKANELAQSVRHHSKYEEFLEKSLGPSVSMFFMSQLAIQVADIFVKVAATRNVWSALAVKGFSQVMSASWMHWLMKGAIGVVLLEDIERYRKLKRFGAREDSLLKFLQSGMKSSALVAMQSFSAEAQEYHHYSKETKIVFWMNGLTMYPMEAFWLAGLFRASGAFAEVLKAFPLGIQQEIQYFLALGINPGEWQRLGEAAKKILELKAQGVNVAKYEMALSRLRHSAVMGKNWTLTASDVSRLRASNARLNNPSLLGFADSAERVSAKYLTQIPMRGENPYELFKFHKSDVLNTAFLLAMVAPTMIWPVVKSKWENWSASKIAETGRDPLTTLTNQPIPVISLEEWNQMEAEFERKKEEFLKNLEDISLNSPSPQLLLMGGAQ